MRDSEAYYHSDAGFYIGRRRHRSRRSARSCATWSPGATRSAGAARTCATSRSPARASTTTAPGSVRTRWTGEVPACRGQRDPRKRDLLEQLQLPPGCAVQAADRRRRAAGPGRDRPAAARRTAQPRRGQPGLRQLHGRRGGDPSGGRLDARDVPVRRRRCLRPGRPGAADRARRRSRGRSVDQAPHAPKPGYTRLELY